jgi:hypothetical protein
MLDYRYIPHRKYLQKDKINSIIQFEVDHLISYLHGLLLIMMDYLAYTRGIFSFYKG